MKSVPTAVVFDVTSDASDIANLGKRRDKKMVTQMTMKTMTKTFGLECKE